MQNVEVKKRIGAPLEAVWRRYTDHVSWNEWAGLGKVTLAREGTPQRDGLGCVRVIANGPVRVHEEVVEFDSPRRMAYRLIRGGGPLTDHLGEVEFAEADGGTEVTWRCRFRSRIPGLGPVMRWGITRMFARVLDALERDLTRAQAGGPGRA